MLRETKPLPAPPRYPRRAHPQWLPRQEYETNDEPMGFVFAEIILRNAGDVELARTGHMEAEDIRQIMVTALVDTGAYTLALPESIVVQLGLPVVEER